MIFETVYFLSSEVNKYLNYESETQLGEDLLILGNASRALDDLQNNDNSLNGKAILSIVNVEEDRLTRQQENYVKTQTLTNYKNPPLYFNIYLLFSINKPNYGESLKLLGKIIQFFQYQNVFTPITHPCLAANIQKLIVDLYTLNFEQLNHLWSTLGGKYLPSVMYKMRMISINEDFVYGSTRLVQKVTINETTLQ